MFEQNIEREISRVKSLFNFDNQFIELEKVLKNSDIDNFYKIYISSEVIWWIYLEDLKRKSLANFNLETKDFSKLNHDLNIYLYNNTIFTETDIDILFRNALNLRINFLIRPFQTLQWFIYRTEYQKPLSEISLKLNYFSMDNFLINFIRQQLFKNISKNLADSFTVNQLKLFDFYPDKNISKFEFINILNKAKESLYNNLSVNSIISPFSELSSLFEKSNTSNVFDIPIQSIIIYLNDFELKNLCEFFENLCIKHNITSLKFDDFQKYIENFLEQLQQTVITKNDDDKLNNDIILSENPGKTLNNSGIYDSSAETTDEHTEFELSIQPVRAELIRVANLVKNELNEISTLNSDQEKDVSEINLAARELSKYLTNELYKSEFDKFLIKPANLRICDIDEIIIFSDEIDESTLEFEFGSLNKI